jgi:hypothetical protein
VSSLLTAISISTATDRCSITGYGWANTYYFVDPGTGVALVLGSQLLPTRDAEILKLWEEIEEVFYGDLKV